MWKGIRKWWEENTCGKGRMGRQTAGKNSAEGCGKKEKAVERRMRRIMVNKEAGDGESRWGFFSLKER